MEAQIKTYIPIKHWSFWKIRIYGAAYSKSNDQKLLKVVESNFGTLTLINDTFYFKHNGSAK